MSECPVHKRALRCAHFEGQTVVQEGPFSVKWKSGTSGARFTSMDRSDRALFERVFDVGAAGMAAGQSLARMYSAFGSVR